MKVLFAVQDEQISTKIVKEYQKKYKEIISYKNIYYFNAILKELQRDRNYDRIIIDEELEELNSSNYKDKDKHIFDMLDKISDEAIDSRGQDIPIILICSDRRTKSEDILVKLFGLGIYNAIIGNDRSTEEVCRLIERPRSKKQAKLYYKIDSEEVQYRPENENEVSEEEMQNILMHFKKISKNEEQYADSFSKIIKQYNDEQIKIIIKILPLNVRAVLEETSPEYQKIVSLNSNMKIKKENKQEEKRTVEKLLGADNKPKINKPIVVPATMGKSNVKKLSVQKPIEPISLEEFDLDDIDDENDIEVIEPTQEVRDVKEEIEELLEEVETTEEINEEIEPLEEIIKEIEDNKTMEVPEVDEPKPKKRGRPKKNPEQQVEEIKETAQPKKRGRPKKINLEEETLETEEDEIVALPGFEEEKEDEEIAVLPGFGDDIESDEEDVEVPGFDDEEDEEIAELPGFDNEEDEEEMVGLPGIDDDEDEDVGQLPGFEEFEEEEEKIQEVEEVDSPILNKEVVTEQYEEDDATQLPGFKEEYEDDNFDYSDFENLLSADKKVVAFVGTSKNGTSFIVNNVAQYLARSGIDTAILDTTQNKNAYYIYTKNEEDLRVRAANSIPNLTQGKSIGIAASENLTVYTSVPGEDEAIKDVGPVLSTLVKNHSAVLIDCDFNTPIEYFEKVQEIYLVQSMDVLTIQPLTAFLRDLKAKNILQQNKIKIVLNKAIKLKSITSKNIIGGMAFYNDPEMSFMTELFDKETVKYVEIPFNEEVYAIYLEGVIDCEITTNKYPKNFEPVFNQLVNMVYPLLPNGNIKKTEKKKKGYDYSIGFSSSVNNTLNDMKRRY